MNRSILNEDLIDHLEENGVSPGAKVPCDHYHEKAWEEKHLSSMSSNTAGSEEERPTHAKDTGKRHL